MSDMKQIGWVVSPDGTVSRPTKKSIRLANAADLHARARVGLMYVDEILKRFGWSCNCIVQSSTSISLEIAGTCIDVSIRRPDRIAYITSRPGWEYKRDVIGRTPDITMPDGKVQKGQEIVRPTADVQIASDFIKEPWVVQIISTSKAGDSSAPIYVQVNKDHGDPAKEIARNVLLVVRGFAGEGKLRLQDTERELGDWDALVAKFDTGPEVTSSGSPNLLQQPQW